MIQLTKNQLNKYIAGSEYPLHLESLVKPILTHRMELYRRYNRKMHPAEMMHGEKKIQPFEYYIVKMAQGYLSGKAPMYKISGKKRYAKQYGDQIDYIRRYNDDAATFSDLMHDYLTTAAAYLYIYENEENEIVYTRFDSRQTVAIYDYSVPANMIAVVRIWQEEKDNALALENVFEIITENERIQWRDNKRTLLEELQWGDVPCTAAEEPDGIAIFEPAIADIDTYEQMVTNIASMTQYNDNAKLLLIGYVLAEEKYIIDENGKEIENPKRKEMEEALYKSKVLSISKDGEIRWLLKDVNYSGMLDVLKHTHDNITMLTGVPNMTDEAFASANNASALGYKLYALDQYSAYSDRVFRKTYLRLWEIITNRLNLKGAAYDFRDIDIIMQRNLPTDRDKSVDRAIKMKNSGLFSDETCLSESQVEVDPADELQKVAAQEETEYQLMKSRNVDITRIDISEQDDRDDNENDENKQE